MLQWAGDVDRPGFLERTADMPHSDRPIPIEYSRVLQVEGNTKAPIAPACPPRPIPVARAEHKEGRDQ